STRPAARHRGRTDAVAGAGDQGHPPGEQARIPVRLVDPCRAQRLAGGGPWPVHAGALRRTISPGWAGAGAGGARGGARPRAPARGAAPAGLFRGRRTLIWTRWTALLA